jgi:hypothetical protein
MKRFQTKSWFTALIVVVMLLVSLSGCVRYYWAKPGAAPEEFNRDSTQCISESSPTTPTLKTGVFIEQMYRSCLNAKGWVRDKQYDPPPPGWFRGVE